MLIGGSGSGKINSLFKLINQQPDIDKVYLLFKDSNEEKTASILKVSNCPKIPKYEISRN